MDIIVKLFSHSGRGIILVFQPTAVTKFQGKSSVGVLNTKGWENLANIAIYLGNGTRWGYSYYETLFGSHS